MSTLPIPRRLQLSARENNRGFSFAEMLVSMMIVTLLTACVATGVAFAQYHYHRTIVMAESKVLYSTLENTLRNELSYSSRIFEDSSTHDIWFYSLNYSDGRVIGDDTEDFRTYCWKVGAVQKTSDSYAVVEGNPPVGQLALVRDSTSSGWTAQPLLASTAYTYNMTASAKLVAEGSGSDRFVHVTLTVYAKDGVIEPIVEEFDVKPLNATITTVDTSTT